MNTGLDTELTGQSKAQSKKNNSFMSYDLNTSSIDDLERLTSPINHVKRDGLMEEATFSDHLAFCKSQRDINRKARAFLGSETPTQRSSLLTGSGKSACLKGKETLSRNMEGKTCRSRLGISRNEDLSVSFSNDTKELNAGSNGFKPCNKCSVEAQRRAGGQ